MHSCHYFFIEVSQACPASRRWSSAFADWVFKPRDPRTGLPSTVVLETLCCPSKNFACTLPTEVALWVSPLDQFWLQSLQVIMTWPFLWQPCVDCARLKTKIARSSPVVLARFCGRSSSADVLWIVRIDLLVCTSIWRLVGVHVNSQTF